MPEQTLKPEPFAPNKVLWFMVKAVQIKCSEVDRQEVVPDDAGQLRKEESCQSAPAENQRI